MFICTQYQWLIIELMFMDISGTEEEVFIREKRIYVGGKIRSCRLMKGFSQKHLANLMNISRPTISKIENGKFAFSVDYLAKFSFHLGFNFTISDVNEKQ